MWMRAGRTRAEHTRRRNPCIPKPSNINDGSSKVVARLRIERLQPNIAVHSQHVGTVAETRRDSFLEEIPNMLKYNCKTW